MEIKSKTIPHTFRNKYLKYVGNYSKNTATTSNNTNVGNYLSKWFYEDKDGNLHSKLNFIGDNDISAYGAGDIGNNDSVTIIDNLSSSATDCALSANQGRVLKEMIDSKGGSGVSSWNDLLDKPSTFPPSEHNHNDEYINNIGVSGNDLIWTKNGKTNNITVPYSDNADKLDGNSLYDLMDNGYLMKIHIIDASALDQNTYYPVTINIGATATVRLECRVSLNSGNRVSWSTHSSGSFSVRKVWEVNGSGWGTTPINRNVLVSDYAWTNSDPVRGIG